MDIGQALRVAFSSLLANKLRSSLTMLGMVIGVGAVITLMSIGQGAQAAVQDQFNSLGTNLVFIDPGTTNSGGVRAQAGSVQTLTYDDAKAMSDDTQVPDAALVAPETSTFGQIVVSGAEHRWTSERRYPRVFGLRTTTRLTMATGLPTTSCRAARRLQFWEPRLPSPCSAPRIQSDFRFA